MANYQIQSGTLLESFEIIGDWTAGGTAGGALAVDTSIFQEGSGSLKITADSSASSNYFATKTINQDMSRAGIISIDVYISDTSKTNSITVYLSSTSNFSKYFSRGITGLTLGRNRIRIYKNWWSNTGSEDWANTMIRLRVRTDSTASGGSVVYFDNLQYGTYHRPKIIWTCDDGWASQYDELYTYAKNNYPEFKFVHYIVGSYIDAQSPTYMTSAQLTEMYNYGSDICNHTYNHTNLTTLGTQAEMEAEVALNKTFLEGKGFTRNNMLKHFCYPNGGYNQTALDALTAQGFLTARSIISQSGLSMATPPLQSLLLIVRNLGNTTTLASVEADMDNAIASGCTLFIESHKFVTTPTTTTEWAIADMQLLLQSAYRKKAQIDFVTLTEWKRGLTEPRKLV